MTVLLSAMGFARFIAVKPMDKLGCPMKITAKGEISFLFTIESMLNLVLIKYISFFFLIRFRLTSPCLENSGLHRGDLFALVYSRVSQKDQL